MKKYLMLALFLIIIFIMFYSVYPKYRFNFKNTVARTNIITGRVEVWSKNDTKWISLTDNLSKHNNPKGPKWADVASTNKYKTASSELKTQIQNKYFDDFIKTAPSYNPDWEWQIRDELFGEKANKEQ